MMITDSHEISINDWVMRVHRPERNGPFPILLMLHGWTGDEKSMWIFADRLPKNALLIAPRGLFPSKNTGGYSWYPEKSKPWPWVNDFSPAVESLLGTISTTNFPEGEHSKYNVIGFSQGAALAYTMAILYPQRVLSLVGLSGFLPDDASSWLKANRLKDLPVFIAHGTEDTLVPVDRARTSVDLLENAGAKVTYCEDDVEHKLSAKCFRGLEAFYNQVKS